MPGHKPLFSIKVAFLFTRKKDLYPVLPGQGPSIISLRYSANNTISVQCQIFFKDLYVPGSVDLDRISFYGNALYGMPFSGGYKASQALHFSRASVAGRKTQAKSLRQRLWAYVCKDRSAVPFKGVSVIG